MSVGLRELRLESGLKAYKIAEYLGISRVQLNNIERGKCKLDILKKEKLAEIYGKTIEQIEISYKEAEKSNDRRRKNV